MPAPTPYPVDGIVYRDICGTWTATADVNITIENLTTRESATTSTNSSGEFSIDPANDLTSGISDNDIIYLMANIKQESETYKFTIDLATGTETKNLYLHYSPLYWKANSSTVSKTWGLRSVTIANADGSARYLTIEDELGHEIIRLDAPADVGNQSYTYSYPIRFPDCIRILERGTGGIDASSATRLILNVEAQ